MALVGLARAAWGWDAELPADRSHQPGAKLAMSRDRRTLAAGARPFGMTATFVHQTAAVLAQVPLEVGALHDAI